MAPRRAAAISAASNMTAATTTSTSAGPSNGSAVNGKAAARKSAGGGSGQQAAAPQASTSNVLQPPKQELSPIVARLRTMWKFAAICQFMFTFDEAFGLSGFESDSLERDLDGTETRVVPDLMRRLLYTLTLNRSIDESNWESHLRTQYNRRDPENHILGFADSPKPWHGLPLPQKIDTIHTLCEWQLWDAERFRKLVKNDEDAHVWRIDPIGWDGQDNTYWLFDDNRLWVQHPPPLPKFQPKAKAPPKKSSQKAKAEAKREAKRKREAAARGRQSATAEPTRKRTRLSRGGTGADESMGDATLNSIADDDDDGSELSDPPSDDEMDQSRLENGEAKVKDEPDDVKPESTNDAVNSESDPADEKPANDASSSDKTEGVDESWIEFEAIAVDRAQWEWIAKRFAKSRHPDEKALHALLHDTVLPKVMADIEEMEKQKALEAAMANRKRSSRIALKESEREEKERDRIARIKMEEKMTAIREEEEARERKEREEVEATRMREERLREREERVLAREREAIERAEREIFEREERERQRELRKLRREQGLPEHIEESSAAATPATAGESEDNWELDCEVCGRHGINLDDSQELVCCEICGVWQHTECWNAFDRKVGRSRRDWENEDFYCSKCRPPAAGQPWPLRPPASRSTMLPSSEQISPAPVAPVIPSQGSPQQSTVDVPQHSRVNVDMQRSHGSTLQSRGHLNVSNAQFTSQPGASGGAQAARMAESAYAGAEAHRLAPKATAQAPSQIMPRQAEMHASPSGFASPQMGPPKGLVGSHMTPYQSAQDNQSSQSAYPQQTYRTSASPVDSHAQNVSQAGTSAGQPSQASTNSGDAHTSAVTSPLSVRPQTFAPPTSATPSTMAANTTSASPQLSNGSALQASHSRQSSSPKMSTLPMRSPQSSSAAATSSIPRNVANQPSGSFPLRHLAARSPLSGPHSSSPPSGMPPVSIGPPLQRQGSPSPAARNTSHSATTQSFQPATPHPFSNGFVKGEFSSNSGLGQAVGAPSLQSRSPHLENELLHSRITSDQEAKTSGASGTTTNEAASVNQGGHPSLQPGPGPTTGSLARAEEQGAAVSRPSA